MALSLIAAVAYWSTDQSAYEKPQQERVYQPQEKDGPGVGTDFWTRNGINTEDSLAQWAMAFFAMLATGVSIWAVCLLRATLKATRAAVKEAAAGTAAAQEAVKVTRETAKRQLRAYVQDVSAEIQFRECESAFLIHVEIKNCGQTPAYNLRQNAETFEADYPLEVDRPHPIPENINTTTLGPMQSVFLVYRMPISGDVNAVFDGLRAEEIGLWVQGTIIYDDCFKQPHTTKFRLVVGGRLAKGGDFIFHSDKEGNEAD